MHHFYGSPTVVASGGGGGIARVAIAATAGTSFQQCGLHCAVHCRPDVHLSVIIVGTRSELSQADDK